MFTLTRANQLLLTLVYVINTAHLSTAALDASERTVTYYPASLLTSHTPRSLVFFNDTTLAHITVPLRPLAASSVLTSRNVTTSCTPAEHEFFVKLLKATARVQSVVTRLMSSPGYSNLVECDSYLRRFHYYDTGKYETFQCARAYKRSLRECKDWALHHCVALTPYARLWLQTRSRVRRAGFCHFSVTSRLEACLQALLTVLNVSESRSLWSCQTLLSTFHGTLPHTKSILS